MASRDQDHEPRTPPPLRDAARMRWTTDGVAPGHRRAPEETAVALVHDASTTAVMMATPADLEDFAVGFSLSEGAIVRVEDILGPGMLAVATRLCWLVCHLGCGVSSGASHSLVHHTTEVA